MLWSVLLVQYKFKCFSDSVVLRPEGALTNMTNLMVLVLFTRTCAY